MITLEMLKGHLYRDMSCLQPYKTELLTRAGVQPRDGGHTHATAMSTPLLAEFKSCYVAPGAKFCGVVEM